MTIYLVGGCVRDTLLNRTIQDIDYVWTGVTPEYMLSLGMKQVGASFPVFLDAAGNEHALARTEKKNDLGGYHGFDCEFNSSITLEQDLQRRDITINSLAVPLDKWEEFKSTKDVDLVVDPYGGITDLESGILRHTSNAFSEDPLRVIRVARFVGRYNFGIAPTTFSLMMQLVNSGELNHLTPERVWLELEKGFCDAYPGFFIQTLIGVGAWKLLFPRVEVTDDILHRLNTGCKDLDFNGRVMLVFSETYCGNTIETLEKYKASTETIQRVQVFKKLQLACLNHRTSPKDILATLKIIDAFRRPELLMSTLLPALIIGGSLGTFVELVVNTYEKIVDIGFYSLTPDQQTILKGKLIGEAIDQERLLRLSP